MVANKLTKEEANWLRKHKNAVERRTDLLKKISFFVLSFMFSFGATVFGIIALGAPGVFIAIILSLLSIIGLCISCFVFEFPASARVNIVSGVIVGLWIMAIFLTQIINSAIAFQYPISMHVLYPNHTNIAVIQSCTGFTNSSSGYLNGQPLNTTNSTTQCNMPSEISGTNPFNCNINGKNITCISTSLSLLNSSYVKTTWKGTILNISKG